MVALFYKKHELYRISGLTRGGKIAIKYKTKRQNVKETEMKNVLKMILGSANDRLVKSYEKTVATINKLEPKYAAMSDDEIHDLTALFREKLKNGEKEKDILPDVFAAVREAAKRLPLPV